MFEQLDRQEIENQYTGCVNTLTRTGILMQLPDSENMGVLGSDGQAYPVPTLDQVLELFSRNKVLVDIKVAQGFNLLELTPMAIPLPRLFDLMETSILNRAAQGEIFQTRMAETDPGVPVRVNAKKPVWVWEILQKAIEKDELIYFPQEYSSTHRGMTKQEVIQQKRICGIPGWSVGLTDRLPIMPLFGSGKTIGHRKQLEVGNSPREYLRIIQSEPYLGETGKTLEEFAIKFLTRLETVNEVSNDRFDNNSMWCLGNYVNIIYAEVVPTGWWNRSFGRVRLDMHRTGNKLCTRSWGVATTVRLY